MLPDESGCAGSALRVFRVPGAAGCRLILEQRGRHFDLSHGLGDARRGDLLDLITRGFFDPPHDLAQDSRQWPAAAPEELLTPFEPRHVGKILALARPPRELFAPSTAGDGQCWFSNRSPATLVASGAQVQRDDAADAIEADPADPSRLVHEVFLAAVIARRVSGLEVDGAETCVAGFMVASDFTRRSLDGRPRHPWFGQSPFGSLVLGPAFVPRTSFDLADVTVRSRRLRGDRSEPQQTRQCAEFGAEVALAVAALSRCAILHPGDLVLIPTGVGLGAVESGDDVRCSIDGIGELTTRVAGRSRSRQQA